MAIFACCLELLGAAARLSAGTRVKLHVVQVAVVARDATLLCDAKQRILLFELSTPSHTADTKWCDDDVALRRQTDDSTISHSCGIEHVGITLYNIVEVSSVSNKRRFSQNSQSRKPSHKSSLPYSITKHAKP